MAESGYGDVPIGDILPTCDLILHSWNPICALKRGENYVQTRRFPQQPVLNVSQKQRKWIILCDIKKKKKIERQDFFCLGFVLTGL